MHLSRQWNCWSLRCSQSIACRRCSNYIFILHWTLGFNIWCEDNCKPSRETLNFRDLVRLILDILQYIRHPIACPLRASYGVSFVSSNFDLRFTIVVAVLYAISCYMYIDSINVSTGLYSAPSHSRILQGSHRSGKPGKIKFSVTESHGTLKNHQ